MPAAWTSAQRKKLSALRHPAHGVPKGYYHATRAAQEALGEEPPYPSPLTHESERARVRHLMSWRGISWSSASGRCFSDELPAPLFGLWVDQRGLRFAVELLLPDPARPALEALTAGDVAAFWCGLRRYLLAASDEDYAAAQEYARPAFEALAAATSYDDLRLRDLLAFAFCRDGAWAAGLLRAFVEGAGEVGDIELLVAATLDAPLARRALDRYGAGLTFSHYYLFDIVESLGAEARPVLEALRGRDGVARKRLEAALEVARRLGEGGA